jgi:hypothetical protein
MIFHPDNMLVFSNKFNKKLAIHSYVNLRISCSFANYVTAGSAWCVRNIIPIRLFYIDAALFANNVSIGFCWVPETCVDLLSVPINPEIHSWPRHKVAARSVEARGCVV